MGTLLRKILKNERGQALAEYHVLIPGTIILALAAAWILGPNIADVYRHVVSVFVGPMECVPSYGIEDNSICDHNDLCVKVDGGGEDSGSFTYEDALTVDSVVIMAGKQYDVRRDDPLKFTYTTDDGCYAVTFHTNKVSWQRKGSGPDCKVVSHLDYWQAPICAPET